MQKIVIFCWFLFCRQKFCCDFVFISNTNYYFGWSWHINKKRVLRFKFRCLEKDHFYAVIKIQVNIAKNTCINSNGLINLAIVSDFGYIFFFFCSLTLFIPIFIAMVLFIYFWVVALQSNSAHRQNYNCSQNKKKYNIIDARDVFELGLSYIINIRNWFLYVIRFWKVSKVYGFWCMTFWLFLSYTFFFYFFSDINGSLFFIENFNVRCTFGRLFFWLGLFIWSFI